MFRVFFQVSLVSIPSREELRQKNLFSVSDCKMYWQSNGEYLAVKVDRYTKTKKSTYTGFELFRVKERTTRLLHSHGNLKVTVLLSSMVMVHDQIFLSIQ
jgi:uncharacterized protein with WD repeat